MSTMSKEMVKAYIKGKLARAISGGIIHGRTQPGPDGHTHQFAVLYDEYLNMFIGETSYAGKDGHDHDILYSVYDITNPTVNPTDADNEAELAVVINPANAPANMRRIISFYNMKEITLTTAEEMGHTHNIMLVFAGEESDRLGRTEASDFSKGLEATKEHDAKLAEVKEKAKNAEAHIEKIIKDAIKNAKK